MQHIAFVVAKGTRRYILIGFDPIVLAHFSSKVLTQASSRLASANAKSLPVEFKVNNNLEEHSEIGDEFSLEP